MNMNDSDKALLLNNGAVTLSNVMVYDGDTLELTINEDNYLSEWTYEDFRYVPNTGFIGQFVERTFDGKLLGIPDNISLDGKNLKLELGIKDIVNSSTNYYSLGTFIVTQIGEKDTSGAYSFQSSDYAKKFNTLYKDNGRYPCLALELLNDVCSQIGVEYANNGRCVCYAITEEGLSAGNYCFKVTDDEGNDTYYDFTLSQDLVFNDSLMLILSENKLIQKKVVVNDDVYSIVRTEIEYTTGSTSSNTQLLGSNIPYYDFINNDFVIKDNQFDEDELCRDVVKAIAALGYTWARIGEDDKLYLDFTKKTTSDVSEYNEIDTDLYYENITTGDTVTPINKVLIGMSQVDGENVYATSESYTEETESAIRIYDNPITHNELLRKIAINGCEVLYGLTYTPLTIKTIGHPWLYGDDYIKITNLSNQDLYTYPFDRKLTYKGYISSDISSTADNKIKQNYEYSKNVLYKVTKTEIDVDKANDRITLLTSRVEDDEEDVSNVKIDIGSIEGRVEHIETDELGNVNSKLVQVTQTMNNIQNLFQITGGSNLIKNSAFLLDDNVWEFTDVGSGTHYHTPIGQGYEGSVIGSIVSKAQIQLKNTKMTSNLDENNIQIALLNTNHSFTYAYKLDENTTGTIRLKDAVTNNIIYEKELTPTTNIKKMQFPEKAEEGEEQEQFIPTNINLKLEIETEATYDGSLYIYDLMLNSGDTKGWEPGAGEVSSTILKMSTYGLQVISTGSNIATLMSAGGFAIYPINSSGEISGAYVTKFDDVGIKTGEAETTKVIIKKYVMDELQLDGKEHHVEYFKEA